MKGINKSLRYSWLSQIPSNIFGLIVGIFLSRILGSEGRGVYFLFQANSQFLLMLVSLGINSGLVYFFSNRKIDTDKLIGISISSLLAMTLIGGLLLGISKVLTIETFIPTGFNSLFFFGYLYLIFILQLTSSVLNGILSGYKEFKRIGRLLFVTSSLRFGVFLILFGYHEFISELEIDQIFLCSLGVQFLDTTVWLIASKKFYLRPNFRIRNDLLVFYEFSLSQHISTFLNFFNYKADIYILSHYRDLTEIGYYTLSANIAQLLWVISQPLSGVLFPYISSERNNKQRIKNLQTYSKLNATLITVGALAIASGAYLIPYVYGSEFSASVLPLQVLLMGTLFSGLTKPFSVFFAATGHVHLNLRSTIVGLFFTFVLGLILIPSLGALGASLASIGAYASIFFTLFITGVTKKYFPALNYFVPNRRDIFAFINQLSTRGLKE